jgi:DNA-binding response OmpR family regulator
MNKKQAKVLVIENQQAVAAEIKNELETHGFKVATSLNTEAGMLRAKAFQFDFFIVNGGNQSNKAFDFSQEICKLPGYEKTPFLFVLNPKVKLDTRMQKFTHDFDLLRLPFDSTEFRIRYNRLLEEPEDFNKKPEKVKEEKKSDNTAPLGRVLLVEDNPLNQKVVGMFIAKLGFEYDVASNGQAAVDLCEKNIYTFILMDIYMPGMDGPDATIKIRANELKGNHRAKIIAITANESQESVKRCYDSGMDDYLVKPFTLDILKEKLV